MGFPILFNLERQVQSGTLLKNKKSPPIYEWGWFYLVLVPYTY